MPDNTANFYITADSSGFDSAVSSLNRLEQAADSVERKLADLEKRLLDIANAAKLAGNTHIGNMTAFGHAMNARFDNDTSNLPPNVQQAHQAYTQAQQQQDSQDQHQNQQSANQKAKQQTQSADGTGGDAAQYVKGQAKDQGDRSFFMRMAETIGRTRTLNAAGAFASGNGGPLVATMAQTITQAVVGSNTLSGVYGRGMGRLQQSAFSALAPAGAQFAPGGGVRSAFMSFGAQGASGGAMMAQAVAAAVPMVVSAVAGGALLAGIVAMVLNSVSSKQITVEQSLRANVSGVEGYTAQGLRGRIQDIATRFRYGQETGYQVATQMGRAGVPGSQMQDALKLTLAMSRLTGMEPTQVGQITSTMMVQGGKSIEGVKDAFLNMRDAAEKGGVSLTKMIDSLSTLQQATGGAAVNVASLASLQSALGPGINAGQLASPLVGSFGVQSIVQSSLLGMPMGKFMAMQNKPMGLMQSVAGFSHGLFGGQNTPMNQEILGSILNGTGLVNTQGMNPQQQQRLMSAFIKGDVRSIQKIQGQAITSETKNVESANTFEKQMALLATGETSWTTIMLQDLRQIIEKVTDIARSITGLGSIFSNAIDGVVRQLPPLQFLAGIFDAIRAVLAIFNVKFGPAHNSNTETPESIRTLPKNDFQYIKGTKFKIGTENGGLWVPASHVNPAETAFASHTELGFMSAASKASGIPLSLMLAIGAKESNFGATSKNIGQLTPPALTALTQANLKGNPFYGKSLSDMNKMVNDPRQNALMEAFYLKVVSGEHKGTLDPETLARGYNGSVAYGAAIQPSEVVISGELKVTDAAGRHIGTAKAQGKAKSTAHHNSHNPQRQPRGQSSHRAQQPPPRPGPPTGI